MLSNGTNKTVQKIRNGVGEVDEVADLQLHTFHLGNRST